MEHDDGCNPTCLQALQAAILQRDQKQNSSDVNAQPGQLQHGNKAIAHLQLELKPPLGNGWKVVGRGSNLLNYRLDNGAVKLELCWQG